MKQILGKLHAIMKDVSYIQKDKTNSHQNYKYASEAAIKEKLHEVLVKHGVLFSLDTSNVRIENNVTWVDCDYSFHDVESAERFGGRFTGSGQARDDKGHYSAITGAIKYILTSTFLIPTGDDPEDDKNDVGDKKGEGKKDVPDTNRKPPVGERKFSADAQQLQQIATLCDEKLNVTKKEDIIPALNAEFQLDIPNSASISREQAKELIIKLSSL